MSTAASAIYKNVAIFNGAGVIESHRRQGIHTQMMHRRINDATHLGCMLFAYQTSSSNIASIGTGQKVGFEKAFKRTLFCKTL